MATLTVYAPDELVFALMTGTGCPGGDVPAGTNDDGGHAHGSWTFLSNHAHVLLGLARDPDARLRDIAERVGITERAAHRIVTELEEGGVITRTRTGRRNHYEIDPSASMRHPMESDRTVGSLLLGLLEPAEARLLGLRPSRVKPLAASGLSRWIRVLGPRGSSAVDARPPRRAPWAHEVVAVGSRQLTPSQRSAMAFVAEQGRAQRGKARETLAHVAKMSNIADHDLAEAVQEIRARARVALHFHPDRPVSGSATVVERLLAEGTYRSQFESKISNGSVSAYPGGERDLWEQQLFGGAYQRPGCQLRERPKYGSLDLMRHSDGPSPRFGSCYLLLDPLATRRCTFTYLDSHQQRDEKGTLAEFDAVLAALFEESFYRDFAIGQPGLTPTALVAHLRSELRRSTSVTVRRAPTRNLNHYIEAQVHGDVLLGEDAQVLVADPSFQGSDTGTALQELATRYAVDLYWHRGFELEVENVPSDFRGPTMPSLAERVAASGPVNAREIGAAVRSLERDPDAWADRGTQAEVLQELKLLWHCAVKFGTVSGAARAVVDRAGVRTRQG